MRRDEVRPYWMEGLFTHREQLSQLTEHSNLIAALRNETEIASQLGKPVGCAIMSRQVTEESIVNRLTYLLAKFQNGFDFSDAAFAYASDQLNED